MVWID